jgi:DNA mismatch endonuclease (patch repair protein)
VRKSPNYRDLKPASLASSEALRKVKSSRTAAERVLASHLRRQGVKYTRACSNLPGRPDFRLVGQQVVIFCDGDFWHGRNWRKRKEALRKGSNAVYWVAKIAYNRRRDRAINRELRAAGWRVLRFWESDILSGNVAIASKGPKDSKVHRRQPPALSG